MNVYSVDEIVDDIFETVGINVDLGVSENYSAYKLYSEFIDPDAPSASDEELEYRIKVYLESCYVPDMDSMPDEGYEYSTYYLDSRATNGIYTKYGDFDTKEESAKVFEDNSISASKCFIYMSKFNDILHFERNLH